MKATLKHNFNMLFLFDHDIENDMVEDIDYDCLANFNAGDEVEILKELPVDAYAKNQKSYVIYNPVNHETVTVCEEYLVFEGEQS